MTPAPSVKRKVARGGLLCSQGRRQDGERKGVMSAFVHLRAAHDLLALRAFEEGNKSGAERDID